MQEYTTNLTKGVRNRNDILLLAEYTETHSDSIMSS